MPNSIRYIRSLGLSEIEEVRNKNIIKSSLQASVEITLGQEDRNLFKNLIAADLFITSEVNFLIEEVQTPIVKISSSSGNKCDRCWKILVEVKENGICKRCSDVIEKHYS